MAKNKVTTGIHGEKDSFERDLKTMKSKKNSKLKELKEQKLPKKKDSLKKPGFIISKLNYSQDVNYGDEKIVVPARCRRGQLKVGDVSKVSIVKGISVVSLKGTSVLKK